MRIERRIPARLLYSQRIYLRPISPDMAREALVEQMQRFRYLIPHLIEKSETAEIETIPIFAAISQRIHRNPLIINDH